MILCNNCGAPLGAGHEFCGECGARNSAVPAPPAPPAPPPPSPSPVVPPARSGGGKGLLIFFGLVGCFVVGIVFATTVLRNGGGSPVNVQTNSNFSYANANVNANANANLAASNTSNASNTYNSNTYASNMNTYSAANGNSISYGNTNIGNSNSNRRPSMSPFEYAEYKIRNNNYLAGDDVSGLSKSQLRLLRNTVFAKYGRVFTQDDDLQAHFDGKSWYTPDYNYTKPNQEYVTLTAADEANLDVIKAAEARYP